jgi:hypothetical protein
MQVALNRTIAFQISLNQKKKKKTKPKKQINKTTDPTRKITETKQGWGVWLKC